MQGGIITIIQLDLMVTHYNNTSLIGQTNYFNGFLEQK